MNVTCQAVSESTSPVFWFWLGQVAMHIEQPFGKDDDDLPLEAYCLNLEADLLALFDDDA